MKKLLFLTNACFLFLISNAQLPDLNGYWEGNYSSDSGSSGNFNCAFYQDGTNVYGVSIETDENYVLEGTIDQDTVWASVSCPGDITIDVKIYEETGSVLFEYEYSNDSDFGDGSITKLSDCGTLIVNYSYTGSIATVNEEYPMNIDIFDTENLMENPPIISVKHSTSSGTAYMPGILTEPVYCFISCGYNERESYFNDFDMPYSIYGPDPGSLEFTPINISPGNSQTINLTFDDTYVYNLTAIYPGGKMNCLGTHDLPFSPEYITYYNNEFYIITNTNYVLIYSDTFENPDTLKTNTETPVFAHAIEFNSNGEYYTCDNTDINRYSSTGEMLNSYSISATEDADIEILDNMICYSNRYEIIQLDNSLTSMTAELNIDDIQTDYPPFATQGFYIRDIAFDNENRLGIALDADPDEDGIDRVIFYNSSLDTYIEDITGQWIMNNPVCLDFDENNYCYIDNYWHDILSVHDNEHNVYSASYWQDDPGTEDGAMNGPVCHVIVDNTAYVIENNNNRVSKFSLSSGSSIYEQERSFTFNSSVFPVPSAEIINISFESVKNEPVNIYVIDMQGRIVANIMDKSKIPKGKHIVQWNNTSLKGIYCIVIKTGNNTETHRVIKL